MSRDLYIKAEEVFRERYFDEHGEEPTDDEVAEGMKDFYGDYLGELSDRAHDRMKDG